MLSLLAGFLVVYVNPAISTITARKLRILDLKPERLD